VVRKLSTLQLDADIAIVRLLDDRDMNPATGTVGCAFNQATGQNVCPVAPTIDIATEFLDNDVWLVCSSVGCCALLWFSFMFTFCSFILHTHSTQSSFKSVLNLIATNGYEEQNCGFDACPLLRK
jgi:hypothetical protein